MKPQAILQALRSRVQPRQWGAIPIFLLLAVALRILLGGALAPPRLQTALLAGCLLTGIYVLAPIPWQWTGDGRKALELWRGSLQAVVWNIAWTGAVVAAFAATRSWSLSPGPLGPPYLQHLSQRSGVPEPLLLTAILLPMAFLVGWFISGKESAEAARIEAERARVVLQSIARQAQAQALQNQLDPHVLYNALGGISELVRQDPRAAERAILSLSELYRILTSLGRRERIRLGEERALLERYLGLARLRIGDRLRTSWDWPPEVDDLELPPLLLQPLVENAIEHGLAPSEEGGELVVAVRRHPTGDLEMMVSNTGCPLDPAWQKGTGLGNLANRLALLGRVEALELRADGPWTRARVIVPVEVPG